MEGLGSSTFLALVSLPRVFGFFLRGWVLVDRSPTLEWLPFPPLVPTVSITSQGAESPGSGCIGPGGKVS